MLNKVNLEEKFRLISDFWSPAIAGELNNQHVKLAKLKGTFDWHYHEDEDELFLVIEGQLTMKLKTGDISLNPGEFIIIPKGVEHCPHAENEVKVLLFEPVGTVNTGNLVTNKTVTDLKIV